MQKGEDNDASRVSKKKALGCIRWRSKRPKKGEMDRGSFGLRRKEKLKGEGSARAKTSGKSVSGRLQITSLLETSRTV